MDVVILVVVCGCAIVGLWWGVVRMAAWVLAVIAALAAGRWAGPAAADLIAGGGAPGSGTRLFATAVAALLAAVLVLLAGLGIRRALKALHLSWLDRLAGMVIGGGGAALILALLLALAASRGHQPAGVWAARLTHAGERVLGLHSLPSSSATPSSTPSTPTSSGQHPN
jgi:uncharacterized membrane protein required for colicin V production